MADHPTFAIIDTATGKATPAAARPSKLAKGQVLLVREVSLAAQVRALEARVTTLEAPIKKLAPRTGQT